MHQQKTIIKSIIIEWNKATASISLLKKEAIYTYQTYLKIRIRHLLLTTCFSQKKWHEFDKMILPTMCSFMFINRHFPGSILTSSTEAGGKNLTSIFDMQVIEKITILTGYLRLNFDLGKLLNISIETI